MESTINFEFSERNLLAQCIQLITQVQQVLLISLNDIFLSKQMDMLLQNKFIQSTITHMENSQYNLENILSSSQENYISGNLFSEISYKINSILNHEFVTNYKEVFDYSKLNKTQNLNKKNYEVVVLSNYMLDKLKVENIKYLLEMGCGKSYLTDSILSNEEMFYIGVDKKDDLMEKQKKVFDKKENCFIMNEFIDFANFESIYNEKIKPKFLNHHEKFSPKMKFENEKCLLFGLHSCGNLTSDTVRLYTQNSQFTHLIIVGCCLNLLQEYISPQARECDDFKFYLKNIGYDSKGSFLEETLLYENNSKVGYPLSNFILNNYPNLYLTRVIRNSAMQSMPTKEDKIISIKDNIFYRKILFRTVLQVFFETFIPEFKQIYGYGKININKEDNFFTYLKIVFKNLNKILIGKDELLKKVHEAENSLNEEIVLEFYERYLYQQNILWAVHIIRLKFAKIIEYIVALDRVIFIKESGINNVELIKIFDETKSVRNLLIYSSRI
jgi:hypothetical protein